MRRARVYRNIARQPEYLGLEPADALALAVVLWVLLTFHRDALAINAAVLMACYVALRIAKRGKPPGYTTDVLRFCLSRRTFLSASEPDVQGRALGPHPARAAVASRNTRRPS